MRPFFALLLLVWTHTVHAQESLDIPPLSAQPATVETQNTESSIPDTLAETFRAARTAFDQKETDTCAAKLRTSAELLETLAESSPPETARRLTVFAGRLLRLATKVEQGTVRTVRELTNVFQPTLQLVGGPASPGSPAVQSAEPAPPAQEPVAPPSPTTSEKPGTGGIQEKTSQAIEKVKNLGQALLEETTELKEDLEVKVDKLVPEKNQSEERDYEIYTKKGFMKVAEIVEEKEGPNGSKVIVAKEKADSEKTIEIVDVVDVVPVKRKEGVKPLVAGATPTPGMVAVTVQTAPAQPIGLPSRVGWAQSPAAVGQFLSNSAALGIVALVVFFFVLFLILKAKSA